MGKQRTITITLSEDFKTPDAVCINGESNNAGAVAAALRGIYGLSKFMAYQSRADGLVQAITTLTIMKTAFALIEDEALKIITDDKAFEKINKSQIDINNIDIEELKRQLSEMRGET